MWLGWSPTIKMNGPNSGTSMCNAKCRSVSSSTWRTSEKEELTLAPRTAISTNPSTALNRILYLDPSAIRKRGASLSITAYRLVSRSAPTLD